MLGNFFHGFVDTFNNTVISVFCVGPCWTIENTYIGAHGKTASSPVRDVSPQT